MICKACGDAFDWPGRLELIKWAGRTPIPGEEKYCCECAAELFRGIICIRPAKLYSGGHDRKTEPDPSQENAVRALEDG